MFRLLLCPQRLTALNTLVLYSPVHLSGVSAQKADLSSEKPPNSYKDASSERCHPGQLPLHLAVLGTEAAHSLGVLLVHLLPEEGLLLREVLPILPVSVHAQLQPRALGQTEHHVTTKKGGGASLPAIYTSS